jgi:hypothetical protein
MKMKRTQKKEEEEENSDERRLLYNWRPRCYAALV